MKNTRIFLYGFLALTLAALIPAAASIAWTRRPATPARLVNPATAEVPRVLSPSICPVVSKFDGSVGIYAKNLKTGQVITLNPDKIFAAASTILTLSHMQ